MKAVIIVYSVFLGLIPVATGLEEIILTECSQIPPPCKHNDTTQIEHQVGDNIKVGMTITLLFQHVLELIHNDTNIALVGPSDVEISNGKHFIRAQDREEYKLDFSFRRLDRKWGEFILALYATNVDFVDTRLLHLEIRLPNITYKTQGTKWMAVSQKETNSTSHDTWAPGSELQNKSTEARLNSSSQVQQNRSSSEVGQERQVPCLKEIQARLDTMQQDITAVKDNMDGSKSPVKSPNMLLIVVFASVCSLSSTILSVLLLIVYCKQPRYQHYHPIP